MNLFKKKKKMKWLIPVSPFKETESLRCWAWELTKVPELENWPGNFNQVQVPQSCPTLCDPMDCSLPGSSVHGILQARIVEWVAIPFSEKEDLPNPGIKPMSHTLQADSLLSGPLGKPKNTEVGSLVLPQGIFPTQKLNPGLLHCRQILYQLSY